MFGDGIHQAFHISAGPLGFVVWGEDGRNRCSGSLPTGTRGSEPSRMISEQVELWIARSLPEVRVGSPSTKP